MFRFAYPEFLWLLTLIPVFAFLFVLRMNWKRKAIRRFGDPELLKLMMPEKSPGKALVKFIMLALAFFFLTVGLANPQIGTKYEEAKRQGVDLIIALDVSNSMLSEDIKPNRLERAKQAIGKLLEKFTDDRIGIVVFAGEARLQLPFTQDYAAARLFLANVSPESVLSQGTAIGAAIETSVKALPRTGKNSKAIVVISDGEDHEAHALEAATAARESGIYVHTLGIGTLQGAPVPDVVQGIRKGYKKGADGNTVMSRLNPGMLSDVANAGGGKFIQASNSDVGLNELFSQINSMQKTDFGSKTFTDYADRFPIFLSISLVLLLIELLIHERRSALSKRLNLFGRKSTGIFFLTVFLSLAGSAYSQQNKSHFRAGNELYKEGKYNEAEIEYRKGLSRDAESLTGRYNLANSLYKQKRYQEAGAVLDSLATNTDSDAQKARIYHNMGNAYLENKDYQQSIEAYKKSLRLNPRDEDTRYNLSYALKKLQQQQQQQQQQKQQDQKSGSPQEKQQKIEQKPKEKPKNEEQKNQINRDEAERILDALNREEKELRKRTEKKNGKGSIPASGKDW